MTAARPSRRAFLAGAVVTGAAASAGAGAALWTAERSRPNAAPRPHYLSGLGDSVRVATDVCVYGGTPAGVAAAVQARRLGRTVALVVLGDHVGGMMSGGLSFADHGFGGDRMMGGLARLTFRTIAAHYNSGTGTGVGVGSDGMAYEPHVAEQVLAGMAAAAGVSVHYRQPLRAVERSGDRITAITTLSGSRFAARAFVDASYEGDLMAGAGVDHTVGREGRSTYGEALAGAVLVDGPQSFAARLDPYVRPGDPGSGLLPGLWDTRPVVPGAGDDHVQAYGFRLCMRITPDGPALPIARPPGYAASRYALLARYIRGGTWDALSGHQPIPGGKIDLNSHGGISTDNVGAADGWATADHVGRERVFADHVTYQQGLLWFLANDTSVPDRIRHRVAQFGLAPDEFVATGGWPHQLYVREARRMRSDVVLTRRHLDGHEKVADGVGFGFYPSDVHPVVRTVVDGAVRNEGTLFAHVPGPYRIPYGALVPRRAECSNLLVPVCLSASHVAYASVRVEPTFMTLGQAAGAAAALAVAGNLQVTDVPYSSLTAALRASGQQL